ncbi:hypothetical protein [Clostridium ihumii]|uniref:hypothetical protein n=1 Tax=Clostridium ihumii TaxID=1470356 RepID=UPI000590BB74|nr:hypothetical protein [Clostridium ihumii]
MGNIPCRLECAYCVRNYKQGGECSGKKNNETGCLIFKQNPLGCIRNKDFMIPIPLYQELQPLDTWCDDWTLNGVDTRIKIKRIQGVKWNSKKGYLLLYCNCDYYVNEFDEGYKESNNKPKLRIIK